MKAIRFVEAHKPAKFDIVRVPRTGLGEVVIAIEAAGLCHSDLLILDGSFPATPPMTLGHEIASRVVEIGKASATLSYSERLSS
jgi:D-arabinose 1-dehydrogenase-like Zn-dependent alcohol dehydrogenase